MTPASSPVSVILADDHELVRAGLRRILEAQPGISVVAEVGDGPSAIAACSTTPADVLVLDLSIPGKGEFNDLHAAMHSVAPVGRNSPVTASIQKMSPGEAWWHARTIVRLYTELLAAEFSAREPAAREPGGRPSVEVAAEPAAQQPPRFLVGSRR